MPNKQQLDKAAWDWTNSVQPDSISQENIEAAYLLKLIPCKTTCRRNVKGNPYCLCCLGEKVWMQDIADDEWHEVDDQNSERRIPNTYVGLKNLGATCYVNSFLQVWFHNPTFRKAVYAWNPQEDPHETPDFSENGSFKPTSLVGHLQMMFAQLQFSSRKYIDPSPFITKLGLNTAMQQDAQEFRQLFISLLEKKLSKQSNPSVRNIINTQYSGEYAYFTRCQNCSTESTSSSSFYDLDLNIKGHKELYQCLDEFIQEEPLDGSNQYFCGVCQSKQNATRFIRLLRLPPILHLQLLRFYFEKQSGCKKKLNSFIRFPEVLDMSHYINRPNTNPVNTVVYELSGVLIHRGPSAYSGHYIAHIKDRITGIWIKFNDETCEKMEGKKLQLGVEEALESTENGPAKPSVKTVRAPKGFHSSNNAYMLVYKLRDAQTTVEEEIPDTDISKWDLPYYLQQAVVEDNSHFEEWVKDLDDQRAQNLATNKAKQNEIRSLYDKLAFRQGEEFEWIPTSWLMKWLSSDPGNVSPVENSGYLCQHNKLNPDHAGQLKLISIEAANEIYQKYGGGPRIKNALCKKCVETRCHILRVRFKVMEDHKTITTLMKAKIPELDNSYYWIGKESLRSWRRRVLRNYEESQLGSQSQESSQDELPDDEPFPGVAGAESVHSDALLIDDQEEEPTFLFNEDLICEHNNLIVDETQRRLIPAEAWNILRQYFPDASEFKRSSTICKLCEVQMAEDKQTKELNRILAHEQKTALQDLYLDKNRPNVYKLDSGTILFAVSQFFVDEWRRFIRDPLRRRPPVHNVGNAVLLCAHLKLDHLLNIVYGNRETRGFVLVWDYEWATIKNAFVVDYEIRATVSKGPADMPILLSDPEVCESCSLSRLRAEERQRLEYTNAKIFVRRVTKADDASLKAKRSPTASLSFNAAGPVVSLLDSEDEEEAAQKAKKARTGDDLDSSVEVVLSDSPTSSAGNGVGATATTYKNPQLPAVRRSNRRRPQRGEKTLTVSSDQTLKDLKVQIMKSFSVAPFDQHLHLDSRSLTDMQATLGSLGVAPGSLLLLRVDELGEDVIDMEEYVKATTPETGFEGTELLG